MNFNIVRLSFNRLKQKRLDKKEYSGTKMQLVEKLLQENYEYSRKRKRGYVDFHLGNFKNKKNEDGDKLYFATLGKYKVTELKKFDKFERKHYKKPDISSPWVTFLIDRDEQVFIIEKNSGVFSNYESLFNSIEDHLNNLLSEFDLAVSIAPITSPIDFWKSIAENDDIYTINFELFMPNLFGHTNESAEDILSNVKEKYNADKISEQIDNEEGALKLSKNDHEVNTWLDWIGKGGGKWFIKCKKGVSKRKNRISSAKEAPTFSTTTDIELIKDDKTILKIVEIILKELKRYYSTKEAGEDEINEDK